MPQMRRIRQQVLQLLCQFDAGNEECVHITGSSFDEDSSETIQPDTKAMKLAIEIWEDRLASDAHIEPFTQEWPIHRQPLIDRNLLRLARYEIVSDMTPPVVAINEAIELAKIFSTKKSASFINGVLDNLFHDVLHTNETGDGDS